jgi:ureidoacrylate peracid hydrolase
MHPTALPPEIAARILARRGRLHVHDRLDPARTALVVIDMQDTFTAPGATLEVPMARAIVPAINRMAAALRAAGGTVAWVRSAFPPSARDWTGFFERLLPPALAARVRGELQHGGAGYGFTPGLEVAAGDLHADKDRFSAFLPGACPLPDMLRARGIDTVLIAGTLTNVCCESSARDAMMENFRVVMLSDANATRSDAEHMGALVTIALSFGDVQTVDEATGFLAAGA